jgi:hypothetical protein
LRLVRQWRRLAETRTWRPLADADTLRETLHLLGGRLPQAPDISDFLDSIYMLERGPLLIRTGRAAREWMNLPGVDQHDPEGIFVAACLWREKSRSPIALPFWSAPELRHNRLALHVGLDWMADFLNCVAAAAIVGLRELDRVRDAEQKRQMLGPTARSRLPDALNAVLRAPIVTSGSLAKTLDVTPQTALGLLRQLMAAGIVREATGRASWRAFALA